ncbi:MAG: hypothetical protein RBR97_07120 [Bacteroidales bacterium]|nr:hypothetical protein [Bacteroidales bacterium]
MKKTYLNDLTSEELKKLFTKNEHLQELANQLHQDNVMFWIGEEIGMFLSAMSDWTIGFDCYNYIKVKDDFLFIEQYKKYIEVYSSDDKTIELVNKANEYLANNYKDDDYDEKIEEFAEKLKNDLIAYFNNCISYSNDEDELIEYLENSNILENYYIMDDDLSIVYEEITKTYK